MKLERAVFIFVAYLYHFDKFSVATEERKSESESDSRLDLAMVAGLLHRPYKPMNDGVHN